MIIGKGDDSFIKRMATLTIIEIEYFLRFKKFI